jgi:hypothetical protein
MEAAECGLAYLAMVAGWHGYRTDLPARGRGGAGIKDVLAAKEVPPQLTAMAQQARAEGLYGITVPLAQPTALAYGEPQPLTAGMQFGLY